MRPEFVHLLIFLSLALFAYQRSHLLDFRESDVYLKVKLKGGVEYDGSANSVRVRVLESEVGELEGRDASLRVYGYMPTWTDTFSLTGKVSVYRNSVFITASSKDIEALPRDEGLRDMLLERYRKTSRHKSYLPLGESFLFGEPRFSLPAEVQKNFLSTGLVHLLVVSGLHVGTVALILMKSLPRAYGLKLALVGVILYSLFIVPHEPPVLRATLMFVLMILAVLSYRQHNTLAILLFSGSVILALFPHYVFSYSFWLSFIATAYIVLTLRDMEGGRIFKGIAVSASAFTGVSPLIGSFSYISPISVLLTPLLAPVVLLYSLLGVLSLLTFMSFPPFVDLFNFVGGLFAGSVALASSVSFQLYPRIGTYEAIFITACGIVALYALKGREKLIPLALINAWLLLRATVIS